MFLRKIKISIYSLQIGMPKSNTLKNLNITQIFNTKRNVQYWNSKDEWGSEISFPKTKLSIRNAKIVRDKEKIIVLLCNISPPICKWMMDNLLIDVVLQKDDGNEIHRTCEQRRCLFFFLKKMETQMKLINIRKR